MAKTKHADINFVKAGMTECGENLYRRVTLKSNLTKMLKLQEQIEQLQQDMVQTVMEGENAEEIARFERRLALLRREGGGRAGADVQSLIFRLAEAKRFGVDLSDYAYEKFEDD